MDASLYAQLPPEPQDGQPPRLQFRFSGQAWPEVLDWLAGQADLSLVMNTVPPGEFNYTDNQSYSPRQAIDLVNGVLATKGFTLVRRDRMLMLVSMKDEVLQSLAPQTTVEELETYGDFEIVSVTFPLEGRSPEAVAAEIQPLLGPYGRAVPLPASKRLLVTDRAGVMRAVHVTIESIPKPKKENNKRDSDQQKDNKAKKPQEKPELRIYELQGSHPDAVIQTLKQIVKGDLVHDPNSAKIYAHTVPSQHDIIAKMMEQLQGDGQPRFRLESYDVIDIGVTERQELLANLAIAAPQARMRIDNADSRLIVWADNQQHDVVSKAVEQLVTGQAGTSSKRIRVYTLGVDQADSALDLLRSVMPRAKISYEPKSGRLLVLATSSEQSLVADTLSQLDAVPVRRQRELRVYPLDANSPSNLVELLKEMAPDAKLTLDSQRLRLTALASSQQHREIQTLLDQLDAAEIPEPAEELAVYKLSPQQEERFEAMKDSILPGRPGIRQVWNRNAGELLVWASPDEQRQIATRIEQLQQVGDGDTDRQFQAFSAGSLDPDSLQGMLQEVAPRAKIETDSRSRRILVWADPQELQAIADAMEQIGGGQSTGEPRQHRSYTLNNLSIDIATEILKESFPQAVVRSDYRQNLLVIEATSSEQTAIENLLKTVQEGARGRNRGEVVFYPITGNNIAAQVQLLERLFRRMDFASGPGMAGFLAMGDADEHAELARTLKTLPTSDIPELNVEIFSTAPGSPYALDDVVETLFPGVRTEADGYGRSLTVMGSASELKEIRQFIDQWRKKASNRFDEVVVTYDVPPELQDDLREVIDEVMDRVDVARSGADQLVVKASQSQHESIQQLVEQAKTDTSGGNQVAVYPVIKAEPSNLLSILRETFDLRGGSNFSYDRSLRSIVAVAPDSAQPKIKELIQQVDGDSQPRDGSVRAYSLANIPADAMEDLLAELMEGRSENVRITMEPTSNRLVVVAAEQDHSFVARTLDALRLPEPEFAVIPLETMDPFTAAAAIDRRYERPDGSLRADAPAVDTDSSNYRLLVRGTAEQLQEIRQMLVRLGESSAVLPDQNTAGSPTRFVPLSGSPRDALAQIREVWPQLRNNPLQILGEDAPLPTRERQSSPSSEKPSKPDPATGDPKTEKTPEEPPSPTAQHSRLASAPSQFANLVLANEETESTPEATGPPSELEESTTAAQQDSPHPIVVIPRERGVTIASEDAAALEQLESLLRLYARDQGTNGGRIQVYSLEHANAVRLAPVLNELFSRAMFSLGGDTVYFVADERLNALVSVGGRAQQRELQSLLQTLDTEPVASSLTPTRPVFITLEHVSAETAAEKVRGLYRAQLSEGGGRPEIEIPRGADPRVAEVLQQINAASRGPLMTLEVDTTSNALLVVAPELLVEEVREFVQALDAQADHQPRRGVRVVPLKRLRGTEVEELLRELLQE